MKKFILASLLVFSLLISTNNSQAQQFNTTLEYCTGTWCQWCPCGHDIIDQILAVYPNTVVLAYHGAGSDPWQSFTSGIRGLMGMSAYPTGTVGRRTGIISRGAWGSNVVQQTLGVTPTITVTKNKSINPGLRQITLELTFTATANMTGNYFINFILTEDNIIYGQTSNNTCSPGTTYFPNYDHDHVVKAMINGDLGEALNTGGVWNQGQVITKTLNYTVPAGIEFSNAFVNYLVYKQEGALSSQSEVGIAEWIDIDGPTNITPISSGVADGYSLSQNYPNPFNPQTNINFTIPKDGNVTLKVYDALGNEVASLMNGFLKKGLYKAEFDGKGLSSGIYFYKLITEGFTDTKKMILSK